MSTSAKADRCSAHQAALHIVLGDQGSQRRDRRYDHYYSEALNVEGQR